MSGRRITGRGVLSALVIAGLTGWAVFYVSRHFEEFRQTLTWEPWFLVLLSILILIHYVLLGGFSQIILKTFGLTLSFKEWFGLAIITTLGNYLLPPRGGAGLRAAYLKARHGFPLAHFVSTFVAFYVLNLGIAAAAGLGALAGLPALTGRTGSVLVWFFAAVLAGTLAAMLFPIRPRWLDWTGLKWAARLIEGWLKIKTRRRLLGILFVLVAANGLDMALMIYFGNLAMGLNLGVAGTILVTAIMSLTSLIAITPGGLGIQEAALVFSTQTLGVSPAQSLALAVTMRAGILAWTFLLGPVFSYLLLKRPVPLIREKD